MVRSPGSKVDGPESIVQGPKSHSQDCVLTSFLSLSSVIVRLPGSPSCSTALDFGRWTPETTFSSHSCFRLWPLFARRVILSAPQPWTMDVGLRRLRSHLILVFVFGHHSLAGISFLLHDLGLWTLDSVDCALIAFLSLPSVIVRSPSYPSRSTTLDFGRWTPETAFSPH
jgi:hypothetical protein